MSSKKVEVFALSKGNQFLDKSDAFKSPALFHANTVDFPSEDAALDKAEALGLHLDTIRVVRKFAAKA